MKLLASLLFLKLIGLIVLHSGEALPQSGLESSLPFPQSGLESSLPCNTECVIPEVSSPVCASNLQTFPNEDAFNCEERCNKDIFILYRKECDKRKTGQ